MEKNNIYYFSAFFLFLLFLSPFQDEEKYSKMRKNMVEYQLKTRDITDHKVLDVMGKVKRHLILYVMGMSVHFAVMYILLLNRRIIVY